MFNDLLNVFVDWYVSQIAISLLILNGEPIMPDRGQFHMSQFTNCAAHINAR